MAAGFGSATLVWMGMMLLYATLRRWFSYRTALMTILLLYTTTNLTWYLVGQPWMSHCSSFFSACLVFYIWSQTLDRRTLSGWILLGAAIGLATLIRPSHAALLLFPLADVAGALFRGGERKSALMGFGVSVAALFVIFSLQLATWYARTGVEAPPGNPMEWTNPNIVSMLFSSHNGLISWHPVTYFGFLGLPLLWRRSRGMCLAVAAVVALQVYMNGAIHDWSGGASFGMRRFIGTLPFFAPGIAAVGSWVMGQVRARPLVGAMTGLVFAATYNFSIATGYKEVLYTSEAPVPFTQVWSVSGFAIQSALGHPFSFPANSIYGRKHGVKATQYDMLSSPRAYGHDIDARDSLLAMYLGEGWTYHMRDQLDPARYAWVTEQECRIVLPLKKRGGYEIVMEMSPLGADTERNVTIRFNGTKLGETRLAANSWSNLRVAPGEQVTRRGLNEITLTFDAPQEQVRAETPPPLESALGFSEEVREEYPYSVPKWAAMRRLTLTKKRPRPASAAPNRPGTQSP